MSIKEQCVLSAGEPTGSENASLLITAMQQEWCEGCSALDVTGVCLGICGTMRKPASVQRRICVPHRLYQC